MSEDVVITDDTDNPVIYCTQKQLAWCVWQISRGQIDWKLDDRGLTPILDDTPEVKAAFEAAWNDITIEWAGRPQPARTLRELMSMFWDRAREGRSFMHYWNDAVVACQPRIT